jgi:hypothetical protein
VGKGCFLEARPNGAGWWRFRYRRSGVENLLSLGTYPDVPLTRARRYVFTALQTALRPMSENTINAAIRRMGYGNDEMTAHGFRVNGPDAGRRAAGRGR